MEKKIVSLPSYFIQYIIFFYFKMTTFSASDMVLESILVSKLRQRTHGADLQLSE